MNEPREYKTGELIRRFVPYYKKYTKTYSPFEYLILF